MKKIGFCPPIGRTYVRKLLFMSQWVFIFTFIICVGVSAKGFPQNKVSLKLENSKMKNAIETLQKQSPNVKLLYSEKLLPKNVKISVVADNQDFEEVLNEILFGSGLVYKTIDSNLVAIVQTPAYLYYTKEISGTIKDEKGVALSGVTIVEKGTSNGTTTDSLGNFKLSVKDSNAIISINLIGYEGLELKVHNHEMMNIILKLQSSSLNEVVVVGYGTQKKSDVTGAISSISDKNFNVGVISNPVQQIQGKVPGLVITMPGGDPNETPIIRLRGQTSLTGGQTPLFVVDGVPLDDASQIVNIPPGDILSYDVLKDASATAIYGARGANGVIIVNTKKGHSGKAIIEYNGILGMDRLAKFYDLLTPQEYKAQLTDANQSYDKGGQTNWIDAITRNALTQSHNLAISGGYNNFSYRASLSYVNQNGIVINNGKNETGIRFNASQKALNNKLDIQLGVVYTVTKRKYADNDIFVYALNTPPTYPVYNTDGSYFGFYDYNVQNAVARQKLQTNKAQEKFSQLYGSLNYEVVKGLKVGTMGSLTYFDYLQGYYQPVLPGVNNINNGYKYSQGRDSKKGDIHINYNNTFYKNNIGITLVHEYNTFDYQYFKASGKQFLTDENADNGLGYGNASMNTITTYKENYKLASFLGRLAYNYDQRYYLTASIRRDGSSKFGSNNTWGNFPSLSFAWRLKNESFIKSIEWINDLKLTIGYGVTGNQDAIDPYRTLLLLGSAGRYYDPSNTSNSYPQAYTPTQNANPDLKWEERHGRNIGIDFGIFGRINGNINYFNDKTKNLLFDYTVPVPPYYVNTILANVGELSNKGLEIQLNGDIIKTNKLNWNLGGQISFIKTRVTSLSGTYDGNQVSTDDIGVGYARGRGLDGGFISYLKVGYSPYVFYLPHYVGTDVDGNQLFESPSGPDHDINNATKYYHDPTPKFSYGINNTIDYGNFSLNFFLRGLYGQKLFNNTRLIIDNAGRLPSNNVTKEALTNGIKDNSPVVSDLWLQKASYLRLDNITFSYAVPLKNGAIDRLKIYVTGNNLFVITPYKGLDPEVRNGDSDQSYIDYTYDGAAYYPKFRSYNFGISLSFK